jgi:tRNA modification GTPase
LAGPPNTGKSTLLNCLAGRQKAIVTDIKGTTRDWVSAECRIGPLYIELIDTAGMYGEANVTSEDSLEEAIQEESAEVLEKADLILLVLDNNQSAEQLDGWPIEKIADKKVLTVLNKTDLPTVFDANALPRVLSNAVQISAKLGTGIENLAEKIQEIAGISRFDFQNSVCFTARQEQLLEELKTVKSREQAASVITELLNERLSV